LIRWGARAHRSRFFTRYLRFAEIVGVDNINKPVTIGKSGTLEKIYKCGILKLRRNFLDKIAGR
jgi:hypothetical protein